MSSRLALVITIIFSATYSKGGRHGVRPRLVITIIFSATYSDVTSTADTDNLVITIIFSATYSRCLRRPLRVCLVITIIFSATYSHLKQWLGDQKYGIRLVLVKLALYSHGQVRYLLFLRFHFLVEYYNVFGQRHHCGD